MRLWSLSFLIAAPVLLVSHAALAQGAAPPPLPPPGASADAPVAPRPAAPPSPAPVPPVYEAPPPDTGPRGVHTHDGFYLRVALGPGFGSFSGELRPDGVAPVDFKGSGFALAGAVMFGGTPARGLVVGGGLGGNNVLRPSYPSGASVDGSPTAENGYIYGFVDYFPDPRRGLHFGGGLGVAGFTYYNNEDQDDRYTSLGPGGLLWVGHDFWVNKQWSLGLEARFVGASTRYRGSDGPDRDIKSYGGALLFSILYH